VRRRSATLLGTAAFAVTLTLAPPAYADETDLASALGVYSTALPKSEDPVYVDTAGSGVPSVSAPHVRQVVPEASEPTGCLPYTVHGHTMIYDNLGERFFSDKVRFRMRWCEQGAYDISSGEGACTGEAWVPYRTGASRCWWQGGRWGGDTFSFRTGGTYHARIATSAVSVPTDYVTIALQYGGLWYGPLTPARRTDCRATGLPELWPEPECLVYVTSGW